MRKHLVILLMSGLILLLAGCNNNKQEDIVIPEVTNEFIITLYYIDSCGYCQAAKEILIPQVKEEFGELVKINYVSVDYDDGKQKYDELVGYFNDSEDYVEGKLVDFNEEYIEEYNVPLIVVGEKYAFLGYNPNLTEEYIIDMKKGLNDLELGKLLSLERYLFKID